MTIWLFVSCSTDKNLTGLWRELVTFWVHPHFTALLFCLEISVLDFAYVFTIFVWILELFRNYSMFLLFFKRRGFWLLLCVGACVVWLFVFCCFFFNYYYCLFSFSFCWLSSIFSLSVHCDAYNFFKLTRFETTEK